MIEYSALLLAGSRPGGDRFAARYGVKMKALIPIAGEPMILRPLRALLDSKRVADVRILTQEPDDIAAVLPDRPRWSVEPSSGTIAETLEVVCKAPSARWPMLVTTADHALLDPAMIEQFCAEAARHHHRKLPGEVMSVPNPAVHALTGKRRHQMRRVSREKHAPVAPAIRHAGVEGVNNLAP